MRQEPMTAYEQSGANLAERQEWAQAVEGWASEELVDFSIELLGFNPTGAWPFEDVGVDPNDWDGTSIEFGGADSNLTLSAEQVKKIQDAGFQVARIFFKDKSLPRADYLTPEVLVHRAALGVIRMEYGVGERTGRVP